MSRDGPHQPRSLFFRLSMRLALVGLVFMVVELSAVVWSYVNRPNELDQLLISAEADRIASDIPQMRASSTVPEDLRQPIAKGTQRAFLIHERGGGVIGQFDDGDIKVADEAPASFLVIRTQRENWGNRFLLSGTRRVTVADEPFWITVAIAGQGFGPFVPVIFNEIRFHVLFPLLLLSLLFLLFNFSVVRSTLRPLRATIAAVDGIDPAQVAMRIETKASSREVQALVSAVNRMLERVERAVRTLKDFAGDAAHELRTPLAIMMLSIGKLPEGEAKSRLAADAQGMKRLVDQMLDLSHVTALEIDANTRADLRAIASDVASELTPLAVARSRSIAFRDAGATEVHGHADAIGRALRNLVENAVSHTPPRTVVEVVAGPGGQCSVRDHGPGIPAAQRSAVLERFHRLDKSRTEGAGLGLAIASTIMTLHGGEIRIEDAPGGGALVRLIFPDSSSS
ncbi:MULTISPECIES: HAMP domain-containing sensor histidine kinase [Hyphomicrobiales]|jgi:two-component system, OmpR family, sensor kinase|uniref:histidine kinase n=1 Tax=Bosea spartocytisi TaxID=2773451 RepID=A0A927E976_9HYPH|nr:MULTISPECIES: HAMP domain-containing sensor histidine kinase [Hyphomicrobiales]MBN9034101.1 HAMP domain-containing histidine kinase [Hyphomicrobiales bacterium]OJU67679.1 MAG: sensor histidine kinase [Rhizobiales bacterium 63-7]KIU53435.1 histidine kinase [Bradyrhizobium elkanii]MBD3846292.1 HAMP domain-containing histidine kinase [Bosea spartocytisi]MCT4473474.1 HAMP domain-containing histidine kinase [Bosea spartocytisi]